VAKFSIEGIQVSATNEQKAQDEHLTDMFMPRSLLDSGNSAAQENASLPVNKVAEKAVSLCNFDSEMNKSDCLKAFPVYEEVLAGLPSTPGALQSIEDERVVTERKWGQGKSISEAERKEYWQKLDRMTNAVDMRFVYGVTLNNYGYKFNDEAAKAKGITKLEEAARLEPKTSEFTGALLQAKRNEAIDFRKAASEGAVHQAVLDLPKPFVPETSWKAGVKNWLGSKLGVDDPKVDQQKISRAQVSNDLQRATVDAPITTKEYIEKAAQKLSAENAKILRDAYEENLH
jgi:hypothetical protein